MKNTVAVRYQPDIIDFLLEDHLRLREGLIKIRNNLFKSDLKNLIKTFISNYELHENIEEEILFPTVAPILKNVYKNPSLVNFEKIHEKVWGVLDRLVNNMDNTHPENLRQILYNFSASTETYFNYEEWILFPAIKEAVDRETLISLGKKANEKISRYLTL